MQQIMTLEPEATDWGSKLLFVHQLSKKFVKSFGF